MNLVLNPFDESYIDRDLSRTGLSILVITPGVGHFAVNKNMLRLTTERLLDLGITLDLVCLAQLPLHVTPIFSFMSHRLPESKEAGPFRASNFGRLQDVLYYDAPDDETRPEEEHYCAYVGQHYETAFRWAYLILSWISSYSIGSLGVLFLLLALLRQTVPKRPFRTAMQDARNPNARGHRSRSYNSLAASPRARSRATSDRTRRIRKRDSPTDLRRQ